MADARKRARGKGTGKGRSAQASPTPATPRKKEDAPGEGGPEEISAPPAAKEETPGRIALPSSGLAADVLAQPEAEAIAPDSGSVPEEGAGGGPSAPTDAKGAQSLSFFAAPAQEQREAVEATEHLATFVLDREEYGVDVRQVQEIRRVGEITAVPRAPEFVRGVINLRGRILPVLDLKKKLKLGEVALERSARIVVVLTQGRMLGLLVDGASQVLKVPLSRVEPPPEEVVERGGDYIRAVAKLDDRLIILIDLERALAQDLGEAPSAAGA